MDQAAPHDAVRLGTRRRSRRGDPLSSRAADRRLCHARRGHRRRATTGEAALRQHDSRARGGSGRRHAALARGLPGRCALRAPHASEGAGVLGRRRSDASAGDRRECRDLLHGLRRSSQTAALLGAGTACAAVRTARRRRLAARPRGPERPHVRRLADGCADGGADGRLLRARLLGRGCWRSRACTGSRRFVGGVRLAARRACGRAVLRAGRRDREQQRLRRPVARVLATAIRRPFGRRGQYSLAGRPYFHDRRRRTRGILLPRSRPAALHAVRASAHRRRRRRAAGPCLPRHRAPGPRRDGDPGVRRGHVHCPRAGAEADSRRHAVRQRRRGRRLRAHPRGRAHTRRPSDSAAVERQRDAAASAGLCQRRQPVPVAGPLARERDRDACGTRRWPRTAGTSARHRESCAGGDVGCSRGFHRLGPDPGVALRRAAQLSSHCRRGAHLGRRAVRCRAVARGGTLRRRRARAPGVPRAGHGGRPRRRIARPSIPAYAASSTRRPIGRRRDPARRRRLADAQLRTHREPGHGLRRGWRDHRARLARAGTRASQKLAAGGRRTGRASGRAGCRLSMPLLSRAWRLSALPRCWWASVWRAIVPSRRLPAPSGMS